MNLHAMANGVIQNVLVNTTVTVSRSTGWTQNSDYERVPTYTTLTASMSVQALSSEQLKVVNNLNLQGEMYSVVSPIALIGIDRATGKGGDLLTFNGTTWLVVHIDETYPDHTKAVIQKQL